MMALSRGVREDEEKTQMDIREDNVSGEAVTSLETRTRHFD